jgi:epoxyqueuosine reductase QueG
VCPFNHGAPLSVDPAWQPRPALDGASVAHLAQLDDDELRAAIRRSAIKRTGVAGLRRNLRVAQANLRDAGGS